MIPLLGLDPGVVRGKGSDPISQAGESGGMEKTPFLGSAKSGSAATEYTSGPRPRRDAGRPPFDRVVSVTAPIIQEKPEPVNRKSARDSDGSISHAPAHAVRSIDSHMPPGRKTEENLRQAQARITGFLLTAPNFYAMIKNTSGPLAEFNLMDTAKEKPS